MDKNFITCGIILFFTDVFCSTIYSIIFKEYRGIFILLMSSVFNIITIVIYCLFMFDEINGGKITILIFMDLIMILYVIMHNGIIRLFVTDDEFPLAAMNFNYIFFLPILFIIVCVPFLLIVVVGALIAILVMVLCLVFYFSGLMIYVSLFSKIKK